MICKDIVDVGRISLRYRTHHNDLQLLMRVKSIVQTFHNCAEFAYLRLELGISDVRKHRKYDNQYVLAPILSYWQLTGFVEIVMVYWWGYELEKLLGIGKARPFVCWVSID